MSDEEKRELIRDIYEEKREWLNNSVKRLHEAGMTVDEISIILDLSRRGVVEVLYFNLGIDFEKID